MKITKKHLNKIVDVIFDDHAMNSQVIECRVWGKLVHIDDKQIIVKSWECNQEDHADPNNELFSIVKSCIKSFRTLK